MSDKAIGPAESIRQPNGQFAPGNPGRRLGSRNRVSHRIVMAVLNDFEQHQDSIFKRLRYSYLPAYIAMVARLMPRQIDVTVEPVDYTDADVARVVSRARDAIDRIEAGMGGVIDLEAAVLDAPFEPTATTVGYGGITFDDPAEAERYARRIAAIGGPRDPVELPQQR